MHFGVDYYPEHWPEERWETDCILMQQAGIEVARLAEFSWHKMEPVEGQYDFEWLHRAVDLLKKYGIKVVLGTPTAAPPAWMIKAHPDILPIDRDGRQVAFGGRHHDCQSNPTYREYCRRITRAMAEEFHDDENVIGWQIDNELGNSHYDLCTCENCSKAFRQWLAKKYGNIEHLNRAWGNAFWSQERNNWEEIDAPRRTLTGDNPSAAHDWKLFCSDLVLDFAMNQISILRELCPNQFITHNFMGFSDKVSYYDLGAELSFVSHDQYPAGHWGAQPWTDPAELAATLDLVRSFKQKPFWIMEQQSSIPGNETMGRRPAKGRIPFWTAQCVAHGADVVCYFRWRTCAMGTEQYWHGILPHSGIPGRQYEEIRDCIAKLNPIMDRLEGAMPKAEIGLLYSYSSKYAMDIQKNNKEFGFFEGVQEYYKALFEKKLVTDFVSEKDDFSRYPVLLVPYLYVVPEELATKLTEYVRNGGTLILTARCRVKDETNLNHTDGPLPGRLAQVAGIEIPEYDCLLYATAGVRVREDAETSTGKWWADLVNPVGDTEVVATYSGEGVNCEELQGIPCVTKHTYGQGTCYYIGTCPEHSLMGRLFEVICEETGLQGSGDAAPEVEFMQRGSMLFVLNHGATANSYSLRMPGKLLLASMGSEEGTLLPAEYHVYEM